eukprot:g7168.t1
MLRMLLGLVWLGLCLGFSENIHQSNLADAAGDPSYRLRGGKSWDVQAALSRHRQHKASVQASETDGAGASPAGGRDFCPQEKLVVEDLTDCGMQGKCSEVRKKMTLTEVYDCLGMRWEMPTSPLPETTEQVPRVVHIVLSDHGTRAFDWTCWVAVKAAQKHLQPEKIMIHILDNVEPWSGWWQEVKKLPEVEVVPFYAKDVPSELNGHKVVKPAHLSDFRRFQMLYEHGGVYIDTDHIFLRSPKSLLRFQSVWGRQGRNEVGHQVAIGCMMTRKKNPLFKALYAKMMEVFDGGWDTHSIKMVDKYFKEHSPPGNMILPYGALFPFSWKRGDLCCDYWYHKDLPPTSLFEGKDFDWTMPYSFHLFHSQSESFFRNDDAYSMKMLLKGDPNERKNWPNALALALKDDFKELYELMEKHLDADLKIRDEAIKANVEKWKIDMNA